MAALFNMRRMTVTSTGTGTLTLGVSSSGWRAFSASPAVPDGTIVSYRIDDTGGAWELGVGTYTASGTTLTRGLRESSTGSLLSVTTSATVTILALAEDYDLFYTLSKGKVYIVVPGYSQASSTAIGGTFQTMATEQGQTVSPTNTYTRLPRLRSSSTPSGSGQTCGFRVRNGGGASRRDIGFYIRVGFGVGDTGATCRMFVGLAANGFLQGTNAEPSTFTDIIGVGGQSGATTLSWYENDATGTATMTALGTGSLGGTAPINTADTEPYELTIFNPPSGNPTLTVRRVTTGDVWTRTPTTDLPSTTTTLCLQLWRNTGATASVANIDMFGIVEDYNV